VGEVDCRHIKLFEVAGGTPFFLLTAKKGKGTSLSSLASNPHEKHLSTLKSQVKLSALVTRIVRTVSSSVSGFTRGAPKCGVPLAGISTKKKKKK